MITHNRHQIIKTDGLRQSSSHLLNDCPQLSQQNVISKGWQNLPAFIIFNHYDSGKEKNQGSGGVVIHSDSWSAPLILITTGSR